MKTKTHDNAKRIPRFRDCTGLNNTVTIPVRIEIERKRESHALESIRS